MDQGEYIGVLVRLLESIQRPIYFGSGRRLSKIDLG